MAPLPSKPWNIMSILTYRIDNIKAKIKNLDPINPAPRGGGVGG